MVFVSEDVIVAGKTYTITDESKAAELAMMQELINTMNRLIVSSK